MKRSWLWLLAGVILIAALLLLPLPWPDALVGSRIVNRVQISAPPERVFAYIATPANWPRWHPASRMVRGVTDRTPGIGESVIETFEVAGRQGDATWTTVELSPLRRWVIEATSSGGGARIVYALTPDDGGTLWVRDLTYRGPNLLFGLLNAVEIRAVMEADSAKAQSNVKRDLERSN